MPVFCSTVLRLASTPIIKGFGKFGRLACIIAFAAGYKKAGDYV